MTSRGFTRYNTLIVALVFLAGMTFIFGWLLDLQRNPNQSNLTRLHADGGTEVVLERNRMGHYLASGKVNDRDVEFLLDTGATDVVIPAGVADSLGLERGARFPVQTANGRIYVYATRLALVGLGGIEIANVPASINPGMDGSEILLGMSFLQHLELVQRGRELRVRVPSG